MNIREFQESLDYLFQAQTTPFVWGHSGIGKTAAVGQYAKRKGYHFFPFYLGTQSDLGDILGLQDFVKDENGRSVATAFAIPEWLKNAVDYCNQNPDSGAVIFLDEFNRARKDILSGMFSLALDKTFHTLKLPKNCHLIAAGNPPTDEYFTTDVDETALMSRFVHIKLEPTIPEWIEYAKSSGVESSLIGFIQEQPQLLDQAKTDFKLPVKPDRRSVERLSRVMQTGLPHHLFVPIASGILGVERVVAYQEYLKSSEKPLSAVEILMGSRFQQLTAWSDPSNTMLSLLNVSVSNLVSDTKSITEPFTDDQKQNLMQFLTILPKDVAYQCIKSLVNEKAAAFREFYTDKRYEDKIVLLITTAKGVEKEAA